MKYLLACILLLGIGACSSTVPQEGDSHSSLDSVEVLRPRPEDIVWTSEFENEAVLIASEVSIEGPPGLLKHFAMQQNDRDFEQRTRASAQGLTQEARVKPDLVQSATRGAWPPLRAQLDNLTIAVSHRLRVLERPENCDVVVEARGEVVWKCIPLEEEKRGETLRLVGEIER